MEEEIAQESGITVGQIFRTIFSQKWLALIIAAAITVIGTLGLYFTGKSSEEYSVSFVLQLPDADSASSDQYTYPDRSSFYYTDLVSYENLKEVASRDGFTGVKVDKIIKNGDISISLGDSKSGVSGLNYTIKVKSKYFKSEGAARDFLEELISLPIEYIGSMHINYDQSLTASKSAITYDEKLTLLKNQATFIQSKYSSLINSYGDVVVKDGNILSHYQKQLQAFIDRGDIERLKTTALDNGYFLRGEDGQPLAAALVKYESEKSEKEREINILKKAYEAALKDISESLADQSSVVLDTSAILSYREKIERLTEELTKLTEFIDSAKTDADFESEVDAIEDLIEGFTDDYAEISSIVYNNKSTVNYLTTGVVEVSGGRGLIMSAAISLVLGIIVAAVVAYIVGWSKQKKADAKASAAVTSDTENNK